MLLSLCGPSRARNSGYKFSWRASGSAWGLPLSWKGHRQAGAYLRLLPLPQERVRLAAPSRGPRAQRISLGNTFQGNGMRMLQAGLGIFL